MARGLIFISSTPAFRSPKGCFAQTIRALNVGG